MRIFIDLTSIHDELSGIERFALNIAKAMVFNDRENQYLLAFKEDVHEEFESIKTLDNIEYEIFNVSRKLILNQIVMPKYLYKNKCDVYLFLAYPSPLMFSNKKCASTVHDMTAWLYPETMTKKALIYFKSLIYSAVKRNKLIITVSENSKKDILNKFNKKNIEVIYNGVDDKYRKYDREEVRKRCEKYNVPENYILCLGTLEPRKNIKLLIDAFLDLRISNKIDHKLVITGKCGWKFDTILKTVKENGLEDDVIFTGFVDEEDLPFIYNGAELFVFPSMYEGFGIPPIEAMACEIPVIVSDSSSLPEVVGRGTIMFKNNDIEDLKSKILEYISLDKETIDRYKSYCCQRARKYNWNCEGKKLVKIIEDNFMSY